MYYCSLRLVSLILQNKLCDYSFLAFVVDQGIRRAADKAE